MSDHSRLGRFVYYFLAFFLSVALVFFSCSPRTNTFLDNFCQVEEAHANPLVIPVFGTLLALLGVSVAGLTVSEYEGNLSTALNDFSSFVGTSVEDLSNTLASSNVGGVLTTGTVASLFPLLLEWIQSKSPQTIDNSLAVVPGEFALSQYPNLRFGLAEFGGDYGYGARDMYRFTYNGTLYRGYQGPKDGGYTSATATLSIDPATDSIYLPSGSGWEHYIQVFNTQRNSWFDSLSSPVFDGFASFDTGGLISGLGYKNGDLNPVIPLSAVSGLTLNSSIARYGIAQVKIKDIGIATYDCATGVWSGSLTVIDSSQILEGAINGVLNQSPAATGDISNITNNTYYNVYNPSDTQLAEGVTYDQIVESTTVEDVPDVPVDPPLDIFGILQKILAAILSITGISAIPALLSAMSGTLDTLASDVVSTAKGVLDAIVSGVDHTLGTLSGWWEGLFDWTASLDLARWLANVWDWIQSLGLAQALAGILEAVQSITLEGVLEGILSIPAAISAAITGFFVPDPQNMQDKSNELKDKVTKKLGFDFSGWELGIGESVPGALYATLPLGLITFSGALFDPSFLIQGVDYFRLAIRGFVALLLCFFVYNQVMALIGGRAIFTIGRQLNDGSGKS